MYIHCGTACMLSFSRSPSIYPAVRTAYTLHRWRDELGRYSNYRATPLQQVFAVIDLRRVYHTLAIYTEEKKKKDRLRGFGGISIRHLGLFSAYVKIK